MVLIGMFAVVVCSSCHQKDSDTVTSPNVPVSAATPEIVTSGSPTVAPTPVVTPAIPSMAPATCKEGPNLWPVHGTVNGWSCWYLAPDGESCTTTCAPYNGYNQAIGITNLDLTINGVQYHQMCACNG